MGLERLVKELPWDHISDYTDQYQLDKDLIAAIIIQESGNNPYATRFEPKWNYFYKTKEYAEMLKITEGTERVHQATSWGLMQIMGTVAREMGFKSYFPRLCGIETNLNFGCRKLAQLVKKYDNLQDAIASYNAGSPIKTLEGDLVNQSYVDKVMLYYHQLKKFGGN